MIQLRFFRTAVLLLRHAMRAIFVAGCLTLVAAPYLFAQEPEKIAQGQRLAHVALSNGVFETIIDQSASMAVKSMLEAFEKESKRSLTPSEHDVLASALRDTLHDVLPIGVLEEALGSTYAKYLTVSDMTELQKFYETDLGRKLLSLQSRLLLDGLAIGETLAKTHEQEFRDRLQHRLQEILRASPLGADAVSGHQSFGPAIEFDTKGVDFSQWIPRFMAQVKRNWFIPREAVSAHGHVVITFNVQKNGTITDVAVQKGADIGAFNETARAAIVGSSPTAPLPPEYPAVKAFVTVTFYFNETPPPTQPASRSASGSIPDGSNRAPGPTSTIIPTTPDSSAGPPNLPPPPGVFRPGDDVKLPHVIKQVKPQYTVDAMRARVQGTVLLECVVDTDGTVREVRVIRSFDPTYGLDDEAIKAAMGWRFEPGSRNGEPVPVLISIELTFRLGK